MNKIKSKVLSFILAILMIFYVTSNTYASGLNIGTLTVDSYRNWVQSQVNMKNTNNKEINDFLIDFDALKDDEKELFISYLNNPDTLKEMISAVFGENDNFTLSNGNIIIKSDYMVSQNKDSINSKAALQSVIATGSKNVEILGVKIFEYSGEIRYSHDGTTVLIIPSANAWISRNFLPLYSFTWSDKSTTGVGTSVATYIGYCTWSFVHNQIGMTIGTHQVGIDGNVRNTGTFWGK